MTQSSLPAGRAQSCRGQSSHRYQGVLIFKTEITCSGEVGAKGGSVWCWKLWSVSPTRSHLCPCARWHSLCLDVLLALRLFPWAQHSSCPSFESGSGPARQSWGRGGGGWWAHPELRDKSSQVLYGLSGSARLVPPAPAEPEAGASHLDTQPWMANQVWNVPKEVWNPELLQPRGFPASRIIQQGLPGTAWECTVLWCLGTGTCSALAHSDCVSCGDEGVEPSALPSFTTPALQAGLEPVKCTIRECLLCSWHCSAALWAFTGRRGQVPVLCLILLFLLSVLAEMSSSLELDSSVTGVQLQHLPTPLTEHGLQTRTFLAVGKNLLKSRKKDARKSCCCNLFI